MANNRIVFFGTPSFAADVLSCLLESGMEVVGVVSRPDRPHGRSSTPKPGPVRLVAEAHHIPHFQPEKVSSIEFMPVLESFAADFFVVVAYGEILSQKVLDIPKLACLNLHASLLPKYRGAAPIQQAIIHGEAVTGISIMHMVRKMDAGDVIREVEILIGENMNYGELDLAMRAAGSKAFIEVLKEFHQWDARRKVQDESLVTFAPKIELEDCQLQWSLPATVLHNLIRGVNPEPGAWCWCLSDGEKKRFKIFASRLSTAAGLKPAEWRFEHQKKLIVGCGEGALELVEVQLEGKKRMGAADFGRGYLSKIKWELM